MVLQKKKGNQKSQTKLNGNLIEDLVVKREKLFSRFVEKLQENIKEYHKKDVSRLLYNERKIFIIDEYNSEVKPIDIEIQNLRGRKVWKRY